MKKIGIFSLIFILLAVAASVQADKGTVKIKTVPGVALIYIDGKRIAVSQSEKKYREQPEYAVINLDEGEYEIEAIKSIRGIFGEHEWYGIISNVLVSEDSTQTIKITMKKRQTAIFQKRLIEKRKIQQQLIQKNANAIIEPEMVEIPDGTITIPFGSSCESNNKPPCEVQIKRFMMSKYEITVEQWYTCIAFRGCKKPDKTKYSTFMGTGNKAMNNISWNDTQQYITWLNKRTSKHYRLPTEAEWAYVAHGNCANCGEKSWSTPIAEPLPVGWFNPNSFGLYDLSGNVMEWVQDCWIDNYKGTSNNGSSIQLENCNRRVVRGSANRERYNRTDTDRRHGHWSGSSNHQAGFRLAQDIH